MLDTLQKHCTKRPLAFAIGATFLIVIYIMILVSGGALTGQAFTEVYASWGGGFVALCLAGACATLVALCFAVFVLVTIALIMQFLKETA